MKIKPATGNILKEWGAMYGIRKIFLEPDFIFRKRLMRLMLFRSCAEFSTGKYDQFLDYLNRKSTVL